MAFGAPKPKKVPPVTDAAADKARADTLEQMRLRTNKGYAGTFLRTASLLQQYANGSGKQTTGAAA